ncbi:MAG TPA: Xaa-Pro peptidase family protein [Terriglobia bacterium]|nr:Xaa-Pro peptidase family protein [Terriglobia bacterium]
MSNPRTNSRADARLIVAASDSDPNLLYATRFFAPDPFIFFQHRGKKHLVMNDLELDRARRQAKVDDVLALASVEAELKERKCRVIDTGAVLRHLFEKRKIRSVLVPSNFPLGLADRLRRLGVRVAASFQAFFPDREIKTEDEVRDIAKAQRAAEKGMEAAISMIRESKISRGWLYHGAAKLTAEMVRERIVAAAMRHGCLASHTIVACGEQGCDPHEAGHSSLRADRPIILDIFPRSQSSGYWGDITRTIVKGRASEPIKALYAAVLAAQSLVLGQIRAGARGDAIHQSILDEFQRRGFKTGVQNGRMQGFFHGTGHGVGLEIHELPRLSPRGQAPLLAGHVVTVEPGLYYSGLGGVRLEDLIVVSETGYRNLTRFPKYLEV